MVIVGNELSLEEKEKVKSKIVDLLQMDEKVRFAYLHGSFLKGEFNDIDLAVYVSGNGSVDNKEIVDFELKKEVEISKSIGFEVDLRCLNYAPNSFCYNVIKNGELLFSFDESLRSDFESLVLVKHHDFKRFRKRYREQAIGV